MIKITKAEAMYLANEKKLQWGEDLHHTYSSTPHTYYLTEGTKAMALHEKYVKDHVHPVVRGL